jgi:predicted transport protein
VSSAIDGPPIERARLVASLERLLGGLGSGSDLGALVGTPPTVETTVDASAVGPTTPPSPKKIWTVEYHLARKPAAIVDLFEKVDALAMALGADDSRRPAKLYIGYYAGKRSFCTIELQKQKVWLYLSLPPGEAKPWVDGQMRDVTNIGHFGMGDTEFLLTAPEQLQDLRTLLKLSYLRNRK